MVAAVQSEVTTQGKMSITKLLLSEPAIVEPELFAEEQQNYPQCPGN